MESILALTHAGESGTTLTKASLEAVTAARDLAARLNAKLTIGMVAASPQHLSKGLPCAAVLAVCGEALAQARFASDAAACEALCRAAQPTIVVAPQSSRFARVMAAVAYRLAGVIDTHITAIGGAQSVDATRWFYRQRIEAVISRDQRPWFLLLDAGTHAPYAAEAGNTPVAQINVELPPMRTRVAGFRAPNLDRQTAAPGGASLLSGWEQTIRPEAKLLFVAGAGWTKKQPDGKTHAKEAGNLILQFLSLSGASLGSSKSLVDQGGEANSVLPFLTHLNQVGQTGSTPRHAKGLATCCHGEEPHVVGWRFIGERRAVTLDPNCGWTRGKADVVYVADAFQVMAKLNELLGKNIS
jgi:electron transfer flavoprotein alpha subunit